MASFCRLEWKRLAGRQRVKGSNRLVIWQVPLPQGPGLPAWRVKSRERLPAGPTTCNLTPKPTDSLPSDTAAHLAGEVAGAVDDEPPHLARLVPPLVARVGAVIRQDMQQSDGLEVGNKHWGNQTMGQLLLRKTAAAAAARHATAGRQGGGAAGRSPQH